MIEKIGHIKNPLTVIAIFAGLAEVSGTVVLPFLNQQTQEVYVWFLMGFPSFLVLLFFITLHVKHFVLYAPSDFREDKSFKDIYEQASGVMRFEKLTEEAKISESTQSDTPVIDTTVMGVRDVIKRDSRATALLAEEFVFAKLNKELGYNFKRNVNIKSLPMMLIDGIATVEDRTIVVEVKYIRKGVLQREYINRLFSNIKRFIESLPVEQKSNIEFLIAIVVDTIEPETEYKLKYNINEVANEYNIKTQLIIYLYTNLENEFQIK